MDILFLITGFIFAIIIPIINIELLRFKGFLYAFLIIVFAIVVLAYVILSIYKFKISKIEYVKSKTIVSWNIPSNENKRSRNHFIFSLIFGVLFGIFIYFKSFDLILSILSSLAFSFTTLGWWLMGIRRLNTKLNETDSFVLSHIGLIFNGKTDVFNGYSKGIICAEKINDTLILNLLKNKKEQQLKIEIPQDKIGDIDAFLKDMNEYFSGEENEK